MEDHEIVDLYWGRLESAISETARKYGKYCHSISYNILCSHEDAEECVNDTWLHAWKAMPPHRPNRLSVFLGKITRNLSLNRYKQYTAAKRGLGEIPAALSELEECIPASDNVEQATEELLLIQSIDSFLQELSGIKRDVFVLRYWYIKPIQEIASKMKMTEPAVTSMLFRLRKELKEHFEEEGIFL